MNKRTILWIRLVVLILAFVVVLGTAAAAIRRGSFSLSVRGGGRLEAEASFAGVDQVDVSARTCAVEILPGDGDAVQLSYYRGGFLSTDAPTWTQDGGTLTVTAAGGTLFGGGRIVIQVPRDAALDYHLESASGSIQVHVAGGSLTVAGKTGSVKIYEPFAQLDVETKTGSIKAAADSSTTRCRLQSSTGSVKLALRDDVSGYTLTAETSTGSVKDTYQDLSYGKTAGAVWGDGSLSITAETKTGSIKLTDW